MTDSMFRICVACLALSAAACGASGAAPGGGGEGGSSGAAAGDNVCTRFDERVATCQGRSAPGPVPDAMCTGREFCMAKCGTGAPCVLFTDPNPPKDVGDTYWNCVDTCDPDTSTTSGGMGGAHSGSSTGSGSHGTSTGSGSHGSSTTSSGGSGAPGHCTRYTNYDQLCEMRTGLPHGYLCDPQYLADGHLPQGCESAEFGTGVCCP
ncbi:MAG TPA: hypothetical protein VHB21_24040 [Minicystis sp.]|nr:hypothetical protein [Minicystis sp.]